LQAWFKDPSRRLPPAAPIRDDNAVIFGYRYPAGAFVSDGQSGRDDRFEDPPNPSKMQVSAGGKKKRGGETGCSLFGTLSQVSQTRSNRALLHSEAKDQPALRR